MREDDMGQVLSVTFSYTLPSGLLLLNRASIQLTTGNPCLIVGENGSAYDVLGGILAGLIPISSSELIN